MSPTPDAPVSAGRPGRAWTATLALILAVSAAVRTADLGRLSFWYDEVVTMRLARTAGPSALLALLGRIDATRAPLHPLLLQGWLSVFGTSEAAGRSLSVVCGVATVALIARLGRTLFDDATGLWAAALAALSPPLVIYSREARMYAWLVLATCLAWSALASLRNQNGATPSRLVLYAATLALLGYSHPLGLLMAGALALASLLTRHDLGLSIPRWFAAHASAALVIAPWLPRYFDHPPESTVGVQPLKMLLGLPIGFVGGNFLVLAALVTVVAFGLCETSRDPGNRWLRFVKPPGTWLLVWLIVPPVVLYLYSRLSHPIFGPERYTLFVAPAYLIMLGHGLKRLGWVGVPVGAAALLLAASGLPSRVFAPDLKADWRGAAALLKRLDPGAGESVVVLTTDPSHNVEVEAASYYLEPQRPVVPMPEDPARLPADGPVWLAVGLRGGRTVAPLPVAPGGAKVHDLPGLRLLRHPAPGEVSRSDISPDAVGEFP